MKKIMLDIAHGGQDAGLEANRLAEKHVNLTVGKLLKDCLSSYNAEVVLTRERDIDVPEELRVKMIRSYQPDLLLSIHHHTMDTMQVENWRKISRNYVDFGLLVDICDIRLAAEEFLLQEAELMKNAIVENLQLEVKKEADIPVEAGKKQPIVEEGVEKELVSWTEFAAFLRNKK